MRQGAPLRGSIGLTPAGEVLAVRLRVPFPIVLKDAIKAVGGTRWHAGSSSWLVPADQGAVLLLAIHGENFAFETPALQLLLPLARAHNSPGLAAMEALLAAANEEERGSAHGAVSHAAVRSNGDAPGAPLRAAAAARGPSIVESVRAERPRSTASLQVSRETPTPDTTAYSDVAFLLSRVEAAVAGAFPYGEWVVGVAQGVTVTQRGAIYLRLMDSKELAAGSATSALDVAIFGDHARRVLQELQRANLRLEEGMTLALRGQVRVYRAKSAVQLIADSIDVRASRGELELRREQVVAQFRHEGLVGRNPSLPLPLLPRAIALVTSGRGDALHDVLRTLERGEVGATVTCFDVAVQGAHLESTVLAALAQIEAQRDRFDLVCVVRGGGAANDLAWWDNVAVGRAIARLSLPVVVGIGHERDQSALHEVARFEATPTAVAASIAAMWENARGWLGASADVLTRQVMGQLERSGQRQQTLESRFAYAASRPLQGASSTVIDRLPAQVAQAARHALRGESSLLAQLRASASQMGSRRLVEEHTALAHVFSRMSSDRVRDRIARDALGVKELEGRVASVSRRVIHSMERELHSAGAVVRASDPARIVERGFSIVRTAQGTLVRTLKDVARGDMLQVSTATGVMHAQVVTLGPERPSKSGEDA